MEGYGTKLRESERRERGKRRIISISVLLLLAVLWYFAAKWIDRPMILPDFSETMGEFLRDWIEPRVLLNLGITLCRVLTGTFYAALIGTVLGLSMGYSEMALQLISPIVNSIRQVPIMAWVPLSIVWFGLGEGPTVFLIFMSAVFPLILNTVSGVSSIDRNYINAAKSMGAGTAAIYRDIIVPGAMPGFLTGLRLAVGAGWMSVICAEFIATNKGFGYLLIEAQQRLQTSKLYSLMIMSALVGLFIDQLIRLLERKLTGWRFRDGKT